MSAEMLGEDEIAKGQVWRKAIPEGRDRVQSRVLVWVVGSLLVWMSVWTLYRYYLSFSYWYSTRSEPLPLSIIGTIGISVAFSALVLALRASTPPGAVFGGMICLVLMQGTKSWEYSFLRSGLMPLVVLFVLTFLATRAGRRSKAKAGLAEGRKGRSASQVIANLSIAALSVSPLGLFIVIGGAPLSGSMFKTPMMLMCLAALVEATADTVSSEIGQAFGGRPVMLLSLKRVEVGTDGAVSLLGSGAGILAGAVVAAVGMWGLRLSILEAGIALAAGVCGLFFDSLLGATVERRGWLGNDLVNFSSTVFAAGMAVLIFRVVTFGW
jgi:uncharacterized protein (TIGR00297 family)